MKKFILIGFWASAGFLGFACGDSDDGSSGQGGASGTSGAAGSAGATNGGSAGSGPTGGASGAITGGAAGSGGSGGSGMGGSAGSGGSDGGVGAEGGMGDGGMGDGGETTTGGSAGGGMGGRAGGGMGGRAGGGMGGRAGGGMGGGGSGGGPSMGCPMNQPTPMSMCTTRGLSCDFGDTICRCNLNNGNWNCFDQNDDCPSMPDPGGNCMGGQTACSYGNDGTCVCVQGDFTCDDGVVTCPATRPNDGASCTMFPAGFDCPYAAGDCSCGTGMARSWNCEGGGGTCPAMVPDEGDPCTNPGLICDYPNPGPGADETCICNTMNDWTCI